MFHLPMRYEDRTHITTIANLRHGQPALVIAQVEAADVRFGRRRSLVVGVRDDSAFITLRFFHFSRSQQKAFTEGKWIHFFGEPRMGRQGLEFVHPEYRLHSARPVKVEEPALTPIYPSTEGIGPANAKYRASG